MLRRSKKGVIRMCKREINSIRKNLEFVQYNTVIGSPEAKAIIDYNIEILGAYFREAVYADMGNGIGVITLLDKMGFKLIRASLIDGIVGALQVNAELLQPRYDCDKVIIVEHDRTVEQQTFTIIHEIAHYIFDFDDASQTRFYTAANTNDDNLFEKLSIEDKVKEERANKFAAAFLMPMTRFVKTSKFLYDEMNIKGTYSINELIRELAENFKVPIRCIKKRILQAKPYYENSEIKLAEKTYIALGTDVQIDVPTSENIDYDIKKLHAKIFDFEFNSTLDTATGV